MNQRSTRGRSWPIRSIVGALAAWAAITVAAPSIAQEVLRVGTNSNGSPWSFHDAASNTEQGIAVELIAAIAKDAGFQIQLMPMTLAELIPALNANKTDIIAANLLITQERQALIAFSDAIAPGGDGLAVLKSDTKAYRTIDDLKGLAIGSQEGSPYGAIVQKSGMFANLKMYPDGQAALRAVTAGEIKAAVVGGNLAAYQIKLGNFPAVKLVKSYQPLINSVDAFGLRKADGELLRKINTSLAKLKANGTLKTILTKYGFD
jgi:polar amino acid transport system substrate-binding protein